MLTGGSGVAAFCLPRSDLRLSRMLSRLVNEHGSPDDVKTFGSHGSAPPARDNPGGGSLWMSLRISHPMTRLL